MISIQQLELPAAGLEELRAEALAERYQFIQTLVEDWEIGVQRFSGPGEILRGCFEDRRLVATGGVTVDPFAGDETVGRIRKGLGQQQPPKGRLRRSSQLISSVEAVEQAEALVAAEEVSAAAGSST